MRKVPRRYADECVEGGCALFDGRLGLFADTRVVHEHIEPPARADNLADHRDDFGLRRYVHANCQMTRTAECFDAMSRRVAVQRR